ncbi:ABC transporter permease [Klebsiella pneumoniae]|uniref:ABC transporter permease n=1 Tax=Klebsiella pneumoniae TaxID=573 RepID=A0A378H4D5_KLEPN|nr:ABC transporter permease [Klebsiella pneumoniae]
MSVAAIETRRSILLTGWCVLAAIVLALVIAVGVSVGDWPSRCRMSFTLSATEPA